MMRPAAAITGSGTAPSARSRSLVPTSFDVLLVALLGPVLVLAMVTGVRPSDRLLCILAAIITVLPLLWRSHAPVLVLVIVTGIDLGISAVVEGFRVPNIEYLWLPPLIALGAVAARRPLLVSILAMIAAFGAMAASIFMAFPGADVGWTLTLPALLCGAAWVLGSSAHAIRSRIDRLEAERKGAESAVRVERDAIASGIEVAVGRAVRRMKSDTELARRSISTDAAATSDALERVEAEGVTAMHELRQFVRRLDAETKAVAHAPTTPRHARGISHEWLPGVQRSDLVVVILAIIATVALTTLLGGGLTLATAMFAPALVALLWRHRFPLLVFLFIAGAYAIVVVLFHDGDFAWDSWLPVIGLLTALAAVAGGTPVWVSIPTALAAWAYQSLAALAYPSVFFENVVSYGLLVAAVWLVGFFGGRRRRRLAQLQRDRDEDARRMEHENAELAHDLHDLIGHSVTVMVLQAAGARRILPQNRARAESALDVIDAAGADALRELDQLVELLRVTAGTPRGTAGAARGLAAIGELVERNSAAVHEIVLRTHGTPTALAADVDATAYEVIREAIANAEKHAGEETRITVDLTWDTDAARIVVVNTDEASPTPARDLSGGYGLTSLRKRVEAVGGVLTWEAGDDHFRVAADLPLTAHENVGSIQRSIETG